VRVPFRLVDVFTPRPFAGNQLCVVPDAGGLDAEAMRAIAREIGFSETTFVTEAAGDRYAMRVFTPGQELPFAGHPTIGTAFVLVAEGRVAPACTQVVAAGEFRVRVDLDSGTARMEQLPAVLGAPFEDRELIASAAGLEPGDLHQALPARLVNAGLQHLLVPVRDLDALRAAVRNGPVVGEVCRASGGESMYLFALTRDGVTARMFDWELGVGEDPATGSAAGPLGAYLAEHGLAGMPGRVLIRQGEQVDRPSELHVEVVREGAAWRPSVSGGVHLVGRGEFEL
jgi:trans-2,3-dihydro-3-hydroxyanthranilate isomerase